jgi:S1-C subfamily serine protease
MFNNPLRHTTLYWLAWAATGLLAALVATRVWPGLLQSAATTGSPATPSVAVDVVPAAAVRVAVSTDPPDATDSSNGADLPRVSSYAPAVQRSAPAVVNIFTQGKVTERLPPTGLEQLMPGAMPPRYRQRIQQGLGSGVIVDAQGHIVTNNHVIAGADKIQVQLADGRSGEAEVVGRDPYTDLAVLRVRLAHLPVMQLGRSDRLQVGDVVLAIGSPLGLTQTVTHGIISATGRADLGVATFENFIQTDAAINEGNSGGALVDVSGALIGINTAVLGKNRGAEGISLAIPVDLVRGVMREILNKGRVVRGWIGIIPVNAEAARAAQLGYPAGSVVIDDLYIDSPALRAGLDVNDRVVSVDGKPVRNAQDATAQIALRPPGSSIKLSGMRGTQRFDTELKVIEMPTAR